MNTCPFNTGDIIEVSNGYLNAVTCRPVKFNEGDRYKVIYIDSNPYASRDAFRAQCINAANPDRIGYTCEINEFMPVYNFFHKVKE